MLKLDFETFLDEAAGFLLEALAEELDFAELPETDTELLSTFCALLLD